MFNYHILFLFTTILWGCNVGVLAKNTDWWKNAVIYQIYPRSFRDSNNDGVGDLKGIIEKLDHIVDMGVTGFWLSPIYKSPQVDQGYDISDYRDIDESYGTMEDFEQLLLESKARGIKVILDFVPNHTSDKHIWFQKSIQKVKPYDDFYIWRDCVHFENQSFTPPNNWISAFKGIAWSWSPERQQCYMHAFASAQPDLNYRNPLVVTEMQNILKFWLEKGVDGFRVDAVPFLAEDPEFRDEPLSNCTNCTPKDLEYLDHIYTQNLPLTYDIIQGWREVVDNFTAVNNTDQKIFMTEAYANIDDIMKYYGSKDGSIKRAHFTFNFFLIQTLNIDSNAKDIVDTIKLWLDNIPSIYTSNWVLGNHDNSRMATRLGRHRVDGFNMLTAILPGVQITYNGEEIGMEDGYVPYQDGKDPSARDPDIYFNVSRDFERTPYQWDNSTNAGFNAGAKPWLPVSEQYLKNNLQSQKADPNSHYNIYKQLIQLRQSNSVLQNGGVDVSHIGHVIVVKRQSNEGLVILLFNIGYERANIEINNLLPGKVRLLMRNRDSLPSNGLLTSSSVTLEGEDCIIISSP